MGATALSVPRATFAHLLAQLLAQRVGDAALEVVVDGRDSGDDGEVGVRVEVAAHL